MLGGSQPKCPLQLLLLILHKPAQQQDVKVDSLHTLAD
jgi:hypothetical protein